jgi:GTPase
LALAWFFGLIGHNWGWLSFFIAVLDIFMMPSSAKQANITELHQLDPNAMPVLAIIGRPNVGKSTLLNRFLGHRHNIVDDRPGVTRDRSFHPMNWTGTSFLLMDTGGVHLDPEDPFAPLINAQVKQAIVEADVLILLVDGKTGITDDDQRLAQWVRHSGKPYRLVVNKVDKIEDVALTYEFYNLGMGDPLGISAQQGSTTVGDLLDEVLTLLPQKTVKAPMPLAEEQAVDKPIHLALVGRPNVGKSSLLNALVGENRTIVSDISGTTRDAIDTPFEHEGKPYVLIDTAGIRRRTKVDYGVELFSVDRSVEAISRADVCVLVIDATEPLTEQDKRIFQKVLEAGNGLLIAVNKWDLIDNKAANATELFKKQLLAEVPGLYFVPFVFISALKGQRVHKLLAQTQAIMTNAQRRIGTSTLNQVIQQAVMQTQPPTVKNKKLKVLYATQVSVVPPTFLLFVNDPKLVKEGYERYLEKKLREAIELQGVPIRLVFKPRGEKESPVGR